MNRRSWTIAAALLLSACGNRTIESETPRPDRVLDFPVLYAENCAACHGVNGREGAAISLGNPAFLAFAGVSNIQRITASGVPGTMMPPFARRFGGTLTDEQIAALAGGMVAAWGGSAPATSLQYAASPGDPVEGQAAFEQYCSKCHAGNALLDPDYLSLVSDQGLRSFIVAGHTGTLLPLNDRQVAGIVAWVASRRGPAN
jgi:cytochrome c oxidase cbb3-type subunit 3/ubiquinol-cytochrome c reductase cytochrome c subunit